MKLVISSGQHIGSRSQQQDSYAVPERQGGQLVVVADGMGGLAHGDLASRVAVDAFVKGWAEKTPEESIGDALGRCLHSANAAVWEAAIGREAAGEMGTTLIAGYFEEMGERYALHWISAGDSGIFVQSRDRWVQLNTPHTLAVFLDEQVEKGMLPRHIAEGHPERESLTSFLGLEKVSLIDRNTIPLAVENGDVVLFASDGLFKFLPAEGIQATIRGDARSFAPRLVEKTIAARMPHQDNVTVVSVSCGATAKRSTSVMASVAILASAVAGGFLWKKVKK